VLCGIAPTLPLLIVARILQGAGGGGLAPSEQAILADTFPVEKRGQAFAVYGMAVVVAPAIGPTLGGWITDNFNWHWIFFINIPIGLLSLWLSNRMVEDPPHPEARAKKPPSTSSRLHRVSASSPLGVGCLEFTLDKGQEKDWFGDPMITTFASSPPCCSSSSSSGSGDHPDPIVDLKLLKNRNFGTAVFLQLILGMVLFGSTVLIPQYLQVAARLHRRTRRHGALSRRLRHDGDDVRRRPIVGKFDPRLMVCDRLRHTPIRHLQPHAPRPRHQPLATSRSGACCRSSACRSSSSPSARSTTSACRPQEQPDLQPLQLRPQPRRQRFRHFDVLICRDLE
jgi:DHA2 family multidrug resistance protein